jgi:hypothetical protein
MKRMLWGACVIGLMVVSPQAYALVGQLQGAGEVLKKAGDKLGKLAEQAQKSEQAKRVAAGFISGLDTAARSVFKGAFSCGVTAVKHPSLLLLGTGVALCLSPFLRRWTGRGISACYNIYARRYPESYFVHGVNGVAYVWAHMNPVAREAAEAAQRVQAKQVAAEAVAQDNQRLEVRLAALGLQVNQLLQANQLLTASCDKLQRDRNAFDDLRKKVGLLRENVESMGNHMGKSIPDIFDQLKTLNTGMENHGKQLNSFNQLLMDRFAGHNKEVQDALRAQREEVREEVIALLKQHDNSIGQRITEANKPLLTQIAACAATQNALQEKVGGFADYIAHALDRVPVAQRMKSADRMNDVD